MSNLDSSWIPCYLKVDAERLQQALDKLEKLREDLEECQKKKITDSVTVTDDDSLWWEEARAGNIFVLANLIGDYRRSQQYEQLSEEFAKLDPKNMSVEAMIICLRHTYGIRDKIHSWSNLLNGVNNMLIARGEDATGLLRGLGDE